MAKKKYIIYHIGSLGDSLIILPILEVVRRAYETDELILLTDSTNKDFKLDLLQGSNSLIDNIIYYSLGKGLVSRIRSLIKLAVILRSEKYYGVIYLVRSQPKFKLRAFRDFYYFKACNIKKMIGFREQYVFPKKKKNLTCDATPHHIDLYLSRLKLYNIDVYKEESEGVKWNFNFTKKEYDKVDKCFNELNLGHNEIILAVGIGGKKQVSLWPISKYIFVIKQLIDEDNVFPVFFGGYNDISNVEDILKKTKLGVSLIGRLTLRESILALSYCKCYLGNDTGTIHMAAAAGIPCCGIYSAHNYRGIWYPYGSKHTILRSDVKCECCYKNVCKISNYSKCLTDIEEQEVVNGVRNIIYN